VVLLSDVFYSGIATAFSRIRFKGIYYFKTDLKLIIERKYA
jgi:hypothetical protein